MHPQWLQLADGAWINMGNVNAVRKGPGGQLRLEFIGDQDKHPQDHRVVVNTRDVALVAAYLGKVAFTMPGEPGVFVLDAEG